MYVPLISMIGCFEFELLVFHFLAFSFLRNRRLCPCVYVCMHACMHLSVRVLVHPYPNFRSSWRILMKVVWISCHWRLHHYRRPTSEFPEARKTIRMIVRSSEVEETFRTWCVVLKCWTVKVNLQNHIFVQHSVPI
jgi:hypothetical protein